MPIYTAEASETFTVTFKNYDNSILKTETVVSGKSATPPEETPVKDGYFFVKWDKDHTNILENTIITAVFRKKINCQSVLKKCNNYTGSIKIPSFTDNLTTAFRNTTSINPEITFKLTKESSMAFGTGSDLGTFYGSAINKIKINGNINNALLLSMINALVKPTTIDIRQLSDNNISNIINDSSIMNAINTGMGGTSHTLLYNSSVNETLAEVEYPSFDNWSYGGTKITASGKNFHVTGISNSHDAPYCFFESTPLTVGQKYRFTVDLIEGDFYLLVGMGNLNNPLNLTFTNNSVDFVADQAYVAFGMNSKSGNYPFDVHVENLTLYKVIEN